ncbi:nuclease domain-containing protein [Apodospora peruviana]|uniref:Probable endonuclease LCL3 n=1 Tax=Apodospora peruviana TaxID=516989 RepID=A0AAE0ITD1_9PEZI|nr:nuclease domain-containing protein [Apodospora peruviana]
MINVGRHFPSGPPQLPGSPAKNKHHQLQPTTVKAGRHRDAQAGSTMPWGLWSSPPPPRGKAEQISTSTMNNNNNTARPSEPPTDRHWNAVDPTPPPVSIVIPPTLKKQAVAWDDSLHRWDWQPFLEPGNIIATTLVVTASIGSYAFYRSFLRRFQKTGNIQESFFRRRNLLGKVTSVGDGDGFRLFHTPGGRLAGWGWLRRVPTVKKELQGRTISIRIAGIDAPEGAHFGRPAQPYSGEALDWLKSYVLGKRVRAYIYRRDQYERVVATVFVRKAPFFLRKDVGLEMLKRGLATIYEAKTGAEFGGAKMKANYLAAEATARQKGKGLWAAESGGFFGLGKRKDIESPRAYKERMKGLENNALGKK